MQNFKVGYQKDITNGSCPVKSVSFTEALRFMESDEKLKQLTERIRQEDDPDERKKLKNGLPGIMVSADTTCRKASDDDNRNPLMFIDLDLKDHPDIDPEKVVDSMSYPWLIGYKKSASGGLHVLCGIEANVETHKRSFHALEEVFASHGLAADKNCKDLKRISYIAHDPDIERTLIEPLEAWDGEAIEPIEEESPCLLNEANKSDATPMYSLEDAKEALGAIYDAIGKPKYEQRLYILSGMYNSYGQAGYDAVQEVFGKKGFDKPIKHLTDKHNAGTVFKMVKELRGGSDVPDDVFPVPAGGVGNNASAGIIFPAMGEMKRLFVRGSTVHEIVKGHESEYLSPLSPERFCSLVEDAGKRVARKEIKKDKDTGVVSTIWRTTTFPVSSAKILLETDASRKHLPPIRQIVNCPVMTAEGETLTRGYHAHSGGTYIGAGHNPEEVLFGTAVRALLGILEDFEFAAKSDLSRAFASLISPALKMGGWIKDDFPLDLAEATESQSGKTFRQKLVCRIYNEVPTSITLARGGVGGIDESISTALVKGRPFITLANMRGKIDSTICEEALRGAGRINCRTLRNNTEVDCEPFMWQLSTNGAELTRDLANRAIVTRIRKKPDGHEWKKYPEGGLEQHIQSNQGFYLGCVFSILSKWDKEGRVSTKESRHDFRGWCRALDGIVQLCGLEPLLDGHREQQERTANPRLQWLREIIIAVSPEQHGQQLFTHDLTDIAEECDIEFPGNPNSRDEPYIKAGKILGKIFKDAESDSIEVDGFSFSRIEEPDYSPEGKGYVTKKYTIQAL